MQVTEKQGESRLWFVGIVPSLAECRVGETLTEMGYESYVPVQNVKKQLKSGKTKETTRVVIPARILVHVTEHERLAILKTNVIKRFLVDRSRTPDKYGRHPVAIVPEKQIDTLQYMLFNSEKPVSFKDIDYSIGERVRVTRGNLKGLEGVVSYVNGNTHISISMDILGTALIQIDKDSIELIDKV